MPHRFPWQPPWPLRLVLAGLIVAAMGLLATALVALGWAGSRQMLLDSLAQAAQQNQALTAERLRRLTEPGAAMLGLLSFDPIASAQSAPARLQRTPLLAAQLRAHPLVSAIYVGYDSGDFVLVRPLTQEALRTRLQAPAGAAYAVQMRTQNAPAGQVGMYHFFDAQLQLLQSRAEPDYRFDPRQRPWYQGALEKGPQAVAISAPYLFFTTAQVGLSMSQRAHQGQAVLGLDMALDDLAQSLDTLRLTPGTELALIDGAGQVVAYRDMARPPPPSGSAVSLRPLAALGSPALLALLHSRAPAGQVQSFSAQGQDWWGFTLALPGLGETPLRLLVAHPVQELSAPLLQGRQRMVLLAAALMLLILPLGWWVGRAMGLKLQHQAAQARRMSRFDFSRRLRERSLLREVTDLNAVMDELGQTINAFLDISHTLGAEPSTEAMLTQVLDKCLTATRCQGGAVYLWQPASALMQRAAHSGSALQGEECFAYPPERAQRGPARSTHTGARQLECELRGRHGELQGLLVLVHASDQAHESPGFHAFITRLRGMLAVAIETRQLIEAQQKLFDAVIHMLAHAVDAKSPYTGGHCQRVPELALALADRLQAETQGHYAPFTLQPQERYAFHLAAWLHDCGKITSPEHIVDKATKLELIYNRIHEIRMRFEVLWRDADIACLQAQHSGAPPAQAEQARTQRQQQLQDDFAFVAACNLGGEWLSDEAIARLQALGETRWLRHFDDRLGLAPEELRLRTSSAAPLPCPEPLLADTPHHLRPWGAERPAVERGAPGNLHGFDMQLPAQRQHMGELHNLTLRRGTLTDADRFAINDHIVQTLVLLHQLPWPRGLEQVPELAAKHHERLDGQGYPRRLPASALSTTDRILALADVFEALTAADRPYKAAKRLSEAFAIMVRMAEDGHLDPQLLRYFLCSSLWQDYAQRYLQAQQLDTVDTAALLARLPS